MVRLMVSFGLHLRNLEQEMEDPCIGCTRRLNGQQGNRALDSSKQIVWKLKCTDSFMKSKEDTQRLCSKGVKEKRNKNKRLVPSTRESVFFFNPSLLTYSSVKKNWPKQTTLSDKRTWPDNSTSDTKEPNMGEAKSSSTSIATNRSSCERQLIQTFHSNKVFFNSWPSSWRQSADSVTFNFSRRRNLNQLGAQKGILLQLAYHVPYIFTAKSNFHFRHHITTTIRFFSVSKRCCASASASANRMEMSQQKNWNACATTLLPVNGGARVLVQQYRDYWLNE